MRRPPSRFLIAVAALAAGLATAHVATAAAQTAPAATTQPELGTRTVPIITVGALRFRDLDRNGTLDPYEDWRLSPAVRAADLVKRMTVDEKAGVMMHGTARGEGRGVPGGGARYDSAANRALIVGAGVNSMITRLSGSAATIAAENNRLQAIAEEARLAIPVTISTDPRSHFQYVPGASVQAAAFSQWPEPLGFGAIGDAGLVRRFGDIVRQEYRAVGIQEALSPQADLATEPRWPRINGTFGEDAALVGRLVGAYVEGFQGGATGVGRDGVIAVVKHWVGYGAAKDGWDSHNSYGRFASFPGHDITYHVRPFLPAFAAHVAGVMPTYSILEGATLAGRPIEPVGAAFNHQLLAELLRGRYGFDGVVLTDWAVTNDCGDVCRHGAPAGQRPSFEGFSTGWGVEDMPKAARFVKAVQAGVDQFGGTEDAAVLAQAVRDGSLAESRLDESVRRVVTLKFRQGLFENPYADTAAASRVVGSPLFRAAGLDAQRRSLVLLENRDHLLPLGGQPRRVWLWHVDSAVVARRGWTVVSDPASADLAIARVEAPYQSEHASYTFGAMQHEGRLEYREGDADWDAVRRIPANVPVIVAVYLDRPAILTGLREKARALVATFGASDDALLDVLDGRTRPTGRLPFELPSSAAAVAAQRSDLPHDSARPLYPMGFGLRY